MTLIIKETLLKVFNKKMSFLKGGLQKETVTKEKCHSQPLNVINYSHCPAYHPSMWLFPKASGTSA